eukprot:Phypoly_transcript_03697.p1 GENE.Phypoly_transcript_03697~~Phypoly_transcript_03697.p1  ORF type:complete len:328 (-),score=80.91 Phypoly_transcript_03697:1234-2217(-)
MSKSARRKTLPPVMPSSPPAETDEEVLIFQSQLKSKVLKQPRAIQPNHTSSATWVLEKRREMQEVQQALDSQKKEFAQHEVDMQKREEALQKKDRELQEALLKFNRFLLDNDTKRSKAERKYTEEKLLKEEKEAEVQQLAKTLEQLKQEKQEKQNLLANLVQYQKYLHSVLEHTEDYKEIKTLIDRWNTLQATSAQLRDSIANNIRESEHARASLKKYKEDKATEILALDNRIAELTKHLEKLEQKNLAATSDYDEKTEVKVAKTLEFGQIKMACENIYRHVIDHQKLSKYKELTVPQQLAYIATYLSDLNEIIKGYRGPLQNNTAK